MLNSTKLNPKVTEDMLLIAEKFPYSVEVFYLLEIMVSLKIERLLADFVKPFFCMLHEFPNHE